MRGLAHSKRSTAPSNGMDAKSSAGVPLSSPAAAQRCAEGAGLDSGAAAAAQSAMPSIAAPCHRTDRQSFFTNAAAPAAPQLQSRISTSLTDVTFGRPFLGRMVGLLCPLLTSALRSDRLTASSVPKDTMQISRSKPDSLHRTPAGFTVLAIDGYGLCDILPARPTSAASYPVSVRRVATLLHASFRRSLAVPPLRFASASPPSGCTGDFHPQTVGHVRHTARCAPPPAVACGPP